MTRGIAAQLLALLPQEKAFSHKVFHLYEYVYDKYEDEGLLEGLVSYLLKNRKQSPEYLKWYSLAIEKELKLAGLYEAYLYSLPAGYMDELPKILTMYFSFENRLPADRKAFLYANIISYKQKSPAVYEAYRKQMEGYGLSMMRQGKMDDDLSVIYQDMLGEGIIDTDVANAFGSLFFMKKVVCSPVDVLHILVYDETKDLPYLVPVKNGIAIAPVSAMSRVFAETKESGRIAEKEAFMISPLLAGERLKEELSGKATRKMGYFLDALAKKKSRTDFSMSEVQSIVEFLVDTSISESYRKKMYPLLSEVLDRFGKGDLVADGLLSFSDDRGLSSETVCTIIAQRIMREEYGRAYELMRSRFGEAVPDHLKLQLVSRIISDPALSGGNVEGTEQRDGFLLTLCGELLEKDCCTEETLNYLIRYYAGPTRSIIKLWKCFLEGKEGKDGEALEERAEAEKLEERILSAVLYTTAYDVNLSDIFTAYMKRRGRDETLCDDFSSYFAHIYLMGGKKVPEAVFEYIYQLYRRGYEWNDSCRFALMKRFSKEEELPLPQYDLLEKLLGECVLKNEYLGFFRSFDNRLVIKYHLYDKMFAQYIGEGGQSLMIRYRKDGGHWEERELIEMYDGIYVRQFVLFYGETIRYQVKDAQEGRLLEEGNLSFVDVMDSGVGGRFFVLNRIAADLVYGNEKELREDMKGYQAACEAAQSLFVLV